MIRTRGKGQKKIWGEIERMKRTRERECMYSFMRVCMRERVCMRITVRVCVCVGGEKNR